MRQFIDADDLFAELLLTRSAHRKTILVVEGGEDVSVYKRMVRADRCEIVPACGRENLIGALTRVEHRGLSGILAISDDDWNVFAGAITFPKAVYFTDHHDLELLIAESCVFDRFLEAVASAPKVQSFTNGGSDKQLLHMVLARLSPVAKLRYLNDLHRWKLKFEGIKFATFVDKNSLIIDTQKLVRCVVANSRNSAVSDAIVMAALTALQGCPFDALKLSCGHDLVEMLAIGLRKCFGNMQYAACEPSLLEDILRSHYSWHEFETTLLCASIREWATSNPQYSFLLN